MAATMQQVQEENYSLRMQLTKLQVGAFGWVPYVECKCQTSNHSNCVDALQVALKQSNLKQQAEAESNKRLQV